MFPSGSLPANVARFCAQLRDDHGFHIGAGEVLDAARVLAVVDVTDATAVRSAWRAILASTREEAAVFDEAFHRYFFPSPPSPYQDRPAAARSVAGAGLAEEGAERRLRRRPESHVESGDEPAAGTGPMTPLGESDEGEAARAARASYSPQVASSRDEPLLHDADRPWVEAARAVVRRVHLGLSRRLRPTKAGRRFDFRRTLRASLQTGGEPLAPRWLGRPPRTPRFVLLVDASRSMGAHAETALTMAAALLRATARVEVFTFSTSLERVTPSVRRLIDRAAVRLQALPGAWGGGTCIGASLTEFLGRFGDRLLGRETLVIIMSDGLDVGDQSLLRAAMVTLHRRSAGIVWLNPLIETAGYEPTAAGMRTALPYVSTFGSVTDASSMAHLSRLIRVRT